MVGIYYSMMSGTIADSAENHELIQELIDNLKRIDLMLKKCFQMLLVQILMQNHRRLQS